MRSPCIVLAAFTAILLATLASRGQDTFPGKGGSGGAGTPGGATTQLQYNNAGAFDGASGIVIGVGETNIFIAGQAAVLRLVVTNGITNYEAYISVSTNNGEFRAYGTNFGFAGFSANSSGPSNVYIFSMAALPSVGQTLAVHSLSSANGTNNITLTNLTITSSPVGATTQVQYNNALAMDGASGVAIGNGETNLHVTGLLTTFNLITTNSIQGIGTSQNGMDGLIVTNTLTVQQGKSASNAWVGGTIYIDNNAYTNRAGDAALTNASAFVVKGFTLTNLYDQVEIWTSGSSQMATATTNNIKWLYGATTILDTGIQSQSNSAWRAQTIITRTGSSSQKIAHTLWWNSVAYHVTNTTLSAAEANGSDITFQVQLASRKPGGITNDFLHAKYWPAPR